jgi:L-cystine uptake protein TcyP (sodium:dicarboxylate symporter family)
MILYLYLLLLLILYIILINHFIKDKKYKNKILLVLSISILFSYLYQSIRNNEGYAVTESLPKSFYVLNTYVYGDDILVLIKEKNNIPRLYKLQKSLKLNKFLKKYEGLKNKGQDVVVKKSNSNNENSLGMYIESVQKKLPLK